VWEKDYAASCLQNNCSPVLRHTQVSYAGLGNNIVDRPSQVSVYDGSGALMAQTNVRIPRCGTVPDEGPGSFDFAGSFASDETCSAQDDRVANASTSPRD
jgi:hypothetical protein